MQVEQTSKARIICEKIRIFFLCVSSKRVHFLESIFLSLTSRYKCEMKIVQKKTCSYFGKSRETFEFLNDK